MKLVILIASLAFVACSSKPKTEGESAANNNNTVEMEAPATVVEKSSTGKAAKSSAPAASEGESLPAITGTEKSSSSCTQKGDTRKITILNVTEGGCGVVYNKMGEDKTVAIAKVDMNYCETVSSKIKTNLEGAGFSCDGSAAASTSSDSAE